MAFRAHHIRDEFSGGHEAVKGKVSLVELGVAPLGVGAVDEIHQLENAVVLGELVVVVVVELGRLQQRQVVARVDVERVAHCERHPRPHAHGVHAQQQRPQDHRGHVGENVLERVRVHRHHRHRRRPLVVLLVDVFVHQFVVQQPANSFNLLYSKYILLQIKTLCKKTI